MKNLIWRFLLQVALWWREIKLWKPFYFVLIEAGSCSSQYRQKEGYCILGDWSCASKSRWSEPSFSHMACKAWDHLRLPRTTFVSWFISRIHISDWDPSTSRPSIGKDLSHFLPPSLLSRTRIKLKKSVPELKSEALWSKRYLGSRKKIFF